MHIQHSKKAPFIQMQKQSSYLVKLHVCVFSFPGYRTQPSLSSRRSDSGCLLLCPVYPCSAGQTGHKYSGRKLYFIPLADEMHLLLCVATQMACTHRQFFLNFKSTSRVLLSYFKERRTCIIFGVGKFYFLSVNILATNVRELQPLSHTEKFLIQAEPSFPHSHLKCHFSRNSWEWCPPLMGSTVWEWASANECNVCL